jgi:glycosyltransferase involved in cell wall biosynthesis
VLVELEDTKMVLTEKSFSEAKPFVVVGIPAYNEESSIARVVLDAQKFADMVLVCDDGSVDLTAKIAERLGADVVRHERNMGYGAALKRLVVVEAMRTLVDEICNAFGEIEEEFFKDRLSAAEQLDSGDG